MASVTALALELMQEGAVVIDLLGPEVLNEISSSFLQAMTTELVEYLPTRDQSRVTFDPSGKLGGSANHHAVVRKVRKIAFTKHCEVLRAVIESGRRGMLKTRVDSRILRDPVVACIPVAPVVRESKAKVQVPNWHRDFTEASRGNGSSGMTPGAADTTADVIIGGWVNLDLPREPERQIFVFGKESHRDEASLDFAKPRTSNKGCFQKLSDQEISQLRQQTLKIRPGQMLMFVERAAHAVSNNAPRRTTAYMLRLFTGCRLSYHGAPDDTERSICKRLELRQPLPIKGGYMVKFISRAGPWLNTQKILNKAVDWVQTRAAVPLRSIFLQDLDAPYPDISHIVDDKFPLYTAEEISMYSLNLLPSLDSSFAPRVSTRKRWRTGIF